MHDLNNHLVSNINVADNFSLFHSEVYEGTIQFYPPDKGFQTITVQFTSGEEDQIVGNTQFFLDSSGRVIKHVETNELIGESRAYHYNYCNKSDLLLLDIMFVEGENESFKHFTYEEDLLTGYVYENPGLEMRSEGSFKYDSGQIVESVDTTEAADFKTSISTQYAYHSAGQLAKMITGHNDVVSYYLYSNKAEPEHYLLFNNLEEILEWYHFIRKDAVVTLNKYRFLYDQVQGLDEAPDLIIKSLQQIDAIESYSFESKSYLFEGERIKTIHRQNNQEIQISEYSYDSQGLILSIADTMYTLEKEKINCYRTEFDYQ